MKAEDKSTASTTTEAPLVAVVVPAKHVADGGGAFRVFQMQVARLKQRGWRVALVIIAARLLTGTSQLPPLVDQLEADIVLLVDKTRILGSLLPRLRLAVSLLRGSWNHASDLHVADMLAPQRHPALERLRPAVAVVNYLSGLSVADALVPRSRQIVVLHDVPPGPVLPALIRRLKGRSAVVTLSAPEGQHLKTYAPEATCLVGLPIGQPRPVRFDDMVHAPNLGVLLDNCGPAIQPAGGWRTTVWANATTLDLLFVGSAHPPNVEGLASFVNNCFLPHLAPHGVNLVVAGQVGLTLWPGGGAPTGIVCLGAVKDVRGLYAATRLVIAPLLSGTGVSIKTIEAIGLGKPVVATSAGLRGLAVSPADILSAPFGKTWADHLQMLLRTRDARKALRDELASGLQGPEHGVIVAELASSLAQLPHLESPPSESAPVEKNEEPLIEWVGDWNALVQLVRASASREQALHQIVDKLISTDLVMETEALAVAGDIVRSLDR